MADKKDKKKDKDTDKGGAVLTGILILLIILILLGGFVLFVKFFITLKKMANSTSVPQ